MNRPPGLAPQGQHWCSGHSEWHAVAAFYTFKGKRQRRCKIWQYEAELARRARDPEKYREEQRARAYKHGRKTMYGLTRADYEAMVAAQGGRCLVCRVKVDHLLVVDHDHDHPQPRSPAAIRGLLCPRCNIGEGFVRMSTNALRMAFYIHRRGDMTGVKDFVAAAQLLLGGRPRRRTRSAA